MVVAIGGTLSLPVAIVVAIVGMIVRLVRGGPSRTASEQRALDWRQMLTTMALAAVIVVALALYVGLK